MTTITKKQIISFLFDFKEISENKLKRAMKKDKVYIIKLANAYENNKTNGEYYRALLVK